MSSVPAIGIHMRERYDAAVEAGLRMAERNKRANYDALIAEHIRTKGVTLCPPGVAAPTTATIPEAVRMFHEMRDLSTLDSLVVRKARETAKRRALIGNEVLKRKARRAS